MKIVQVHPGILPIPPNGWGAVEKIIWEYKLSFEKLGHTCDIKYLNEIDPIEYDVVHVHMGNLANECYVRKIPYYFTCHDHHVYLYGKDHYIFKQNYLAAKNSIKTFLPAKYLVKYFDLPNVEYLSHGVNNNFFTAENRVFNLKEHKLLCVANNGISHDNTYDRKKFGFAIKAAKILDLPITVAGPFNNKNFFDHFDCTYDKLNILYDLNEQDLLKQYQQHTIFLHLSDLEAGHPNLTLLEAMSCGMPVIATLEDNNEISGLIKSKRDVETVVKDLNYVIQNYENLVTTVLHTSKEKSWDCIVTNLVEIYNQRIMGTQLLNIYNTTKIKLVDSNEIKNENKIEFDFNYGTRVSINGNNSTEYMLDFIDSKRNQLIYRGKISNNMWSSPNPKYYVDWHIKVTNLETNQVIEKKLNLENQDVRIVNESPAFFDFLAWLPFVDLFQKKHNCNLDFFTPHINLVENSYSNLNFYPYSDKEKKEYNISYKLGYFDITNKSLWPNDVRTIPLQQISSDILGLEYFEITPKLTLPSNLKNNFNKKYVCIGSLSTAQAKFWNNPDGWYKTVNYLKELGYEVISIDKHNNIGSGDYKNYIPANSIDKTGNLPLEERINDLYFCDFFIGLGSGLSWLAWAIGKPVILISGFSDPISEFPTPYRVHSKEICNSCWNDTSFEFDMSKWDWCPRNKDFECSKQITFETVKEKIDQCILDN